MTKKVVLIGTLDTKGREMAFIKSEVESHGVEVTIVDAGVFEAPGFEADISNVQVAMAGGGELTALRRRRDRGMAMGVMTKGVTRIAKELYSRGELAAIIGLGGSGGTTLASAAMKEIPIGIPKLIISTVASGDTRDLVGGKDICMMHSVADISGINRISRPIFRNAGAAIAGMARNYECEEADTCKTVVAATMCGVVTPCVSKVRDMLEKSNYEVIVFHTTGSGGEAMEQAIDDGFFHGVVDITTSEIMNDIFGRGGAGPNRLETAGRKGIPQVVSVGGLDYGGFWTHALPDKYKNRTLHQHNPKVVLVRSNIVENEEAARIMSKKLNWAKGPTAFVVPLRGFSDVDKEGGPLFDPEADKAFVRTLEKNLSPKVELIKVDAHINDAAFAEKIVEVFSELESRRKTVQATIS